MAPPVTVVVQCAPGQRFGISIGSKNQVLNLDPEGSCAAAGIELGDVLAEMDGVPIKNEEHLFQRLRLAGKAQSSAMEAVVPAGVQGGQSMLVVTSAGSMQIAVPAGLTEGQKFQFALPSSITFLVFKRSDQEAELALEQKQADRKKASGVDGEFRVDDPSKFESRIRAGEELVAIWRVNRDNMDALLWSNRCALLCPMFWPCCCVMRADLHIVSKFWIAWPSC